MTIKDQPDHNANNEYDEEKELGGQMTFLEHLGELRERLIRMLIAVIIAVAICLSFADTLFYVLMLPVPNFVLNNTERELKIELKVLQDSLEEQTGDEAVQTQTRIDDIKEQLLNGLFSSINTTRVMVTSPIEYVMIWFKVAFVAGIFLAFPYLFYEIWMFVSPGLYKRERKLLIPVIFSSWLCFVLGGLFCYFFIFRFTLQFLVDFAPGFLDQSWIVTNYINIFLRMLIAFGIVFEEPVVIYLLTKMGFVSSVALRKFRPYAVVGMFAFAALITPPDVFSQMGCAFPLIFFYEISIIIATFIEKKEDEAIA
jgi:sec-independent protein translocase protein TatC